MINTLCFYIVFTFLLTFTEDRLAHGLKVRTVFFLQMFHIYCNDFRTIIIALLVHCIKWSIGPKITSGKLLHLNYTGVKGKSCISCLDKSTRSTPKRCPVRFIACGLILVPKFYALPPLSFLSRKSALTIFAFKLNTIKMM